MMKWIFTGFILLSVLFGSLFGRIGEVSNAALSECARAVELVLKLMGAMCLWSGLMKVAEEAKLTDKISGMLRPITKRLFKGLPKDSPALKCISMNITANLLGLGNAATPLGLSAMKELSKLQAPEERGAASNEMITLVVLNTASIQLIPTTIAMLRLEYGSQNPMEVLPAILASSFISVCTGLILCKLLERQKKKRGLGR